MPHKFHYYKGGIFGLQGECREDLHGGHAITLIGYGTDKSGNDYWIIKNSWGTDWGKNGFAKISRSRDCLPKYGMVPIVWKYEQIMGLFLDWNKVNTYIKHSFYLTWLSYWFWIWHELDTCYLFGLCLNMKSFKHTTWGQKQISAQLGQ